MKTIKFKSLSSGSCGNCYFLGIFEGRDCECSILIDAGVSTRRLTKELKLDGEDYVIVKMADILAVVE